MNTAIYERLKEAARQKRFVTYSDLSAAIELSLTDAEGLNKLNVLLTEIADHEIEAGRPLLVAIIVSESNNMPGSGLFSYAKRKGLMKANDKDNLTFFITESRKVHEFWATR